MHQLHHSTQLGQYFVAAKNQCDFEYNNITAIRKKKNCMVSSQCVIYYSEHIRFIPYSLIGLFHWDIYSDSKLFTCKDTIRIFNLLFITFSNISALHINKVQLKDDRCFIVWWAAVKGTQCNVINVFYNSPASYMIHQMLLEHVAPLTNCVKKSLPKGSQAYLKPGTKDLLRLHPFNLHKQALIVINLNIRDDKYNSPVLEKSWTENFRLSNCTYYLVL